MSKCYTIRNKNIFDLIDIKYHKYAVTYPVTKYYSFRASQAEEQWKHNVNITESNIMSKSPIMF